MADEPQSLDDLVQAQKRCPQCGHANRLAAKVCTNCGYHFPIESVRMEDTAISADPVIPGGKTTSKVSGRPTRAKTCPECGTVVELDAKFCLNCGHRFSTDFSKPPPASAPKPATSPVPAKPAEPPIVQMPSSGVEMAFTPPPPTILPSRPAPPPVPVIPPPVLPVNRPNPPPEQYAAPDDPADDSLDGAPAPDLTEIDLNRLRRRPNR